MAIHKIPNVSINGKSKIYNGYIYNISYQAGASSEPSQMTLSLISEDGTYGDPSLGYDQLYRINIGGESFSMYAYESTITSSPDGNILEILFEDPLVKLNQYFVGLKGKHGAGTSGCIIIVGNEILPGEGKIEDKCFNNEEVSNIKTLIDYNSVKATSILEVEYNFADLINEIGKTGLTFIGAKNKNKNYTNRYTGPLKDVLNSWCADFGYSYYYDHKAKAVKFIDVSTGISIRMSEPSNDKLIDKKITKSVKGTTTKGLISYFGAEGQTRCLINNGNKGFIADFTRIINGYPITLESVFPQGAFDITASDLNLSSVLSLYSPTLRNAYFYYNKYSLQSGADGVSCPELGDLRVFKELSSESTGEEARVFDDLLETLQGSNTEQSNFNQSQLRFWLAYQDEDKLAQQINFERDVASSFLGKYWYADYGITNIRVKTAPPKIISDSGEGIYYDSKNANSSPIYIDVAGFNYQVNVGLTRFVLVERSAAWFPDSNHIQVLESKWAKHLPVELSTSTQIADDYLKTLVTSSVKDPTQIKVYAVILPSESPQVSTGGGNHPKELGPQKYENLNGNTFTFGMLDKSTSVVNYDGFQIYTPIGSFGSALNQYKIIVEDALGYLNTCKTLPKVELFLTNVSCDPKLENLEINYVDMSNTNFNLYKYDVGSKSCKPDLVKLKNYQELYSTSLNYKTPKKFERRSYTVGGLPDSIPSVTEGLLDFNINISAEKGIISNITVGNSAAVPPSVDYQLAKAQFSTNKSRFQYSKTLNYHQIQTDVT